MNALETNAARLLNTVTGIIKQYETQWQKTGKKYNLFKVARIEHDEIIMCRALADLMNPQGKHCQGSRYLKSFWETIASKAQNLTLDIEHTKITTEYVIDEKRRIDITLDDGTIFVPIEVKIRAPDQPKQLADYFDFANTKSKNRVPALYLTVDGREPQAFSKNGLKKGDYIRLSFKQDILAWLEACAENTPETTIPIRENLRQLIAAVKSLCGKSEDAEMEDAIYKLITKDDETVQAALAIRGAVDFNNKAWEAFKGPISERVIKRWNGGEYLEEEGWYYTWLPIKNGNYWFEFNYLWDDVCLKVASDAEDVSAEEKNALYEKMSGLFGQRPKPDARFVWQSKVSWPSFAKDELYKFHLCKLYTERPQEVVDRIISIAKALERVKA